MSDHNGIRLLLQRSPDGVRRLIEAAGAHGDVGLAADQSGVDRSDAEALLLYDGDDPRTTEASIALYAAVTAGRKGQNAYAKRVFLAHLAHRGIVTEAVAAQPWHPASWFYLERGKDPDFDAMWLDALGEAKDRLHAEAWRRGVDGVDKPLVWQGEITTRRDPLTGEVERDADGRPLPATVKEYSDTMLAMLLKRHDPGFRDSLTVDQRTTIAADGAGLVNALAGLTDAEVGILVKLTRAPGAPGGEEDADGTRAEEG
jgi:hypothetical protein